MTLTLTTSQIDKLGERLRRIPVEPADLSLLSDYRQSFHAAYEYVIASLNSDLALTPTGRAAKSTASIVAKLQRERTRLSRMQDIAGCRVVVEHIVAQNEAVDKIKQHFQIKAIHDRRIEPSHGYRAVHAIVEADGRVVEIQVRTLLQHVWAEVSEKLADRFGIHVKYGGQAGGIVEDFRRISPLIARHEGTDLQLHDFRAQAGELSPAERAAYEDLRQTVKKGGHEVVSAFLTLLTQVKE